MPHIIIEYSANLATRTDLRELVRKTHDAALATGLFELAGLRTRCEQRDIYRIADGHPDNSFLTVNIRIGHGRDEATRHRVGEAIFDCVCEHLAPIYATTPIGITVDVAEIDPVATFKKNNMRDIIKARQERSAARAAAE
jgi:5-carboxymethyl-2-hydroxymuconate isomerase